MMGIYLMEFAWWAARPVWTLLFGGVFEYFPKLKFAMTEAGEFWIPSMLQMMDIRASVKHTSGKLGDFRTHLKMKPSEYFARNVWIGASLMDRECMEVRHDIGIGRLMWGADYPHPEGAWPNTHTKMVNAFKGLPEEELTTIFGMNAIPVYNFDLEKLTVIAERIGPEKKMFEAA